MRFALVSAAIAATAGALDAPVWTFDNDSKGPSISPENARLVLAHRLGLSKYHKIGNADEDTLTLLNKIQSPIFTPKSTSRKMMLVVEGLEGELSTSAPSFTISNPPNSVSNGQLVADLLVQDMHSRDSTKRGEPQGAGLIEGGISANNPAGLHMIGSNEKLSKLPSLEQLQALSGDANVMANLVYGVTLPPSITSDYTAIFHIKNLADLAAKHGIKSTEYRKMRTSITETVSEARESGRFNQLIVVGIPSQTTLSKRDDYGSYEMPRNIRKEQPLRDTTISSTAIHAQATSSSNRTIPKTTTSVCWSSESACKANTADCSGHGSCVKKYSEKISDDETGAECWACACKATSIDGKAGKKTIYWGGSACQKKDISVPFFLFAGFTVAALAALAYGVAMLYSIGEEDLPSVLGAGVAPTTRK